MQTKFRNHNFLFSNGIYHHSENKIWGSIIHMPRNRKICVKEKLNNHLERINFADFPIFNGHDTSFCWFSYFNGSWLLIFLFSMGMTPDFADVPIFNGHDSWFCWFYYFQGAWFLILLMFLFSQGMTPEWYQLPH